MNRLRSRAQGRPDSGLAMLFVIAIGLVIFILVGAMLASVAQTQKTTRKQRNITSAQGAAEAGLNDAVFQLGQYNAAGQSNWSTLPSSWTKASPNAQSFGSNASYAVWLTQSGSNLIIWSRGTYGGDTRTIRAVVSQNTPPAFDFSMFAQTGVDIHHHGSSWLSPTIWTTSVHSNGYINIDYSSEFSVNTMEAVGNIQMQKGGGSYPSGSIPTTGYAWYDPLNGKCFPGGLGSPGGANPTQVTPSPVCPSSYSGNAVVSGTLKAGSVTVGTRGQVLPVASAFQTETGQTVNAAAGDVYAGSASIGGTSYTTTSAANACSNCNKGASATAGQIGGALHVTPGYAPATIPFPSINYATTYRVAAQNDQNSPGPGISAGTHVFASATAFWSYITNPANGYYRTIGGDGTLSTWSSASGTAPQVIYLSGNYDITGGSLTINYSNVQKLVNAATSTTGPAPILMIQGSLVAETGGISLSGGLIMVGTGNRTDFLTAGTSTTPVTVNIARFLDPNATGPAVLAAGGSINADDYDTDSSWTSASQYEPAKATPQFIRGLVYAATYNAATGTSTAQNQHWHSYDPKNLQKIYGAQVGNDLHDCNNFSFSYDPLIKKAFGFGGGTVQVLDYQELGT
jgi:hypothetical protein